MAGGMASTVRCRPKEAIRGKKPVLSTSEDLRELPVLAPNEYKRQDTVGEKT